MDINSGSNKVRSALAAEAWALRVACSMALSWATPHQIIESDCTQVIDSLKSNGKVMLGTANKCAHWLASKAHSLFMEIKHI